uniref:Globin n=1 Tax=Polypedilum nubifer TaxID=54969 RepID=V5YMH7_9DIPT|nr:globin [Polypedilum nubifer]
MKFLIVLALVGAAVAYTPLSSGDADVVRSAWDKVKHSEVDILAAVFSAHPDIQAKFPAFVGKDLDSIKGSAAFALHATRIVSFVSEVLALAGNSATVPAIKTLVNQLGQNHKNRGVTKDQFNEFRASLTSYVSGHAPWGDNVAAAWNHALDNVYEIIFSNLDGHPVA